MAPLAVSAVLVLIQKVRDTSVERELHLARGAASSSDPEDPELGKLAWLFAPVLIFLLVAVAVIWFACFASQLARKDAGRQKHIARVIMNPALQSLPKPRYWKDCREDNNLETVSRSTTRSSDGGPCTSNIPLEEELCSICLSAFVRNDMIRQTGACSHIFHQNCLEEWIMIQHQTNLELSTSKKLRCPMCRTEIIHKVPKKPVKPQKVYLVHNFESNPI